MRKLIYGIIILLVIIIFLFIEKNYKVNNKKQISGEKFDIEEKTNYTEIKNKLEKALNTSKKLMENSEDFSIYFGLDYINSNMQDKDRIVLVNNLELKDFSAINIYDSKNNLISNIPSNIIKDSDKDNLVIEPDKDSLIKIYSNDDKITYYFILRISKNGEIDIKGVCYTVGENDDSKIIWTEEDLSGIE